MSAVEWRASTSLASLFAVRMFGLFMLLPVFAIHAPNLVGGTNAILVGIALGIYGLTQALFQIPLGMASDRLGRKRVIVFGLALFVVGSIVAAATDNIYVVILGRALQGAGAISAAVMALAADLTRDEHRTKAMAMIGASIGLAFSLSFVVAPLLYAWGGLSGLFIVSAILGLIGIAVVLWIVPAEPVIKRESDRKVRRELVASVLRNPELLRLNLGMFILHFGQVALFLLVPTALTDQAGLAASAHWKIYLPVVILSFALMIPPLIAAERAGKTKLVFLSSVAVLFLVQAGFLLAPRSIAAIAILLLVYFVAFNILEASMPSLVSKIAVAEVRGTAIGVFNTAQALGIAAGGAVSGLMKQNFGADAVFVVGLALVALWWIVASPMHPPARSPSAFKAPI